MPVAVTEDVLDANVYFSDPEKEFGFVVYNHEGVSGEHRDRDRFWATGCTSLQSRPM